MSRILVTGSADGLGRATADALLSAGHDLVVHARNQERAAGLDSLLDRGADIVVGDFTERDTVRRVAAELNDAKPLDAVIHNAGVWSGPAVMPVNIIAPYLLTALLRGPRRLVYLSSSSHLGGRPSLGGVDWRGESAGSYADSKLFVTMLAAAVARLRPNALSNAVAARHGQSPGSPRLPRLTASHDHTRTGRTTRRQQAPHPWTAPQQGRDAPDAHHEQQPHTERLQIPVWANAARGLRRRPRAQERAGRVRRRGRTRRVRPTP
ncbi:SDR family NAD(P)-dependent oxidoreductase [Streptomyces sp. NBC_00996]|uniref:SDR family NAD(P)-dependent oxidoreductase n=1 Tax=Streptomyces sp. NBC_00996 TaxID=2903710 RepID=UPI00386D130D